MSAEDRLSRALAAPAAPAKDMHFTLQVMRQAEAARFKAETAGAWAADNADAALDLGLAVGGVAAVLSLMRGLRRGASARAR